MSESEVNWIKLQNTKVIDLDLKSCTIDKNEQSIFQLTIRKRGETW